MTVPLTIADGTPSVSQWASDSSPTASRTPSNPTARTLAPWASLATRCATPCSTSVSAAARARRPPRPSRDAAVSWMRAPSRATRPTRSEVDLCLGVAFRVGEHRRDPVRQEPAEDPLEPERPAEIGHLDEHVGRVAAQAEAPKLVGREPVHPLQRELAARQDLDRDPLVRDGGPDGGERLLHLVDRGRIVVPYVRRAGDRPHAAGGGRPGELDAVGERLRPVVEARKNVGMQVDHGASRLASAPGVAGSATGYCEPPPATIPLAVRTYVRFNGERAARVRLARPAGRARGGARRAGAADEAARHLFALRAAPQGAARSLLEPLVEQDARLAWRGSFVALVESEPPRSRRRRSSSSTSRRPGWRSASARICEIGAVRVERLEVGETFETLVAPGVPLPAPIGRLTGLTDEQLRRAPRVATALRRFSAFAGDAVLVAHNARFDVGFVNARARAADRQAARRRR